MVEDKINIQQCKVQTVHYFLEKNNIYIDEKIIFLLGINEFLQYGLEKYKQQLFWFVITYNEENLKEIFKLLDIKETYLSGINIEQVKELIDHKEDICIYFDYESRKDSLINNEYNYISNKLPIRNIGKNSFGMIIDYDDNFFILNIIDLDNKNVKIPYNVYLNHNLSNDTVLLELDKHKLIEERELLTKVIDKLDSASKIYLTELFKYEYDYKSGKYGVSGYSSFLALDKEIKNIVLQMEQSSEKKYTEILKNRLNIMRIYMGKGSESSYRKEIGSALIYLSQYNNGFKLCGEMFNKLGIKWRNFNRFLFHVNTLYYSLNVKRYVGKLSTIILELCEEEFAAVTELKRQITLFKNNQ